MKDIFRMEIQDSGYAAFKGNFSYIILSCIQIYSHTIPLFGSIFNPEKHF